MEPMDQSTCRYLLKSYIFIEMWKVIIDLKEQICSLNTYNTYVDYATENDVRLILNRSRFKERISDVEQFSYFWFAICMFSFKKYLFGEAKAGGSWGKEIETILANMVKTRLH